MPNAIGVRFRPVTKTYYFDPYPLIEIEVEDRVIVETSRGIEMGTVVMSSRDISQGEIKGKLKRVIRKASPVDLMEAAKYKIQELDALHKCGELVKEMNIPIKVIQAEYSFDGSRLLFSFAAEQRIDFRDLVKELTRTFKTRIEMKQVGARDETKILDGYGRCGRRLCCSSWLTEFHSVSIKMAKRQDLPLAPSEISGLCGRLLCCLAYEDQQYAEIKQRLPKVGIQVQTPQGAVGIVRGLNIIKETVLLELEGGDPYVEISAGDVEPLEKAKQQARDKMAKSK